MLAVAGAKPNAERLFHSAPQCGKCREARALLKPRQRLGGVGCQEEGNVGWPGQRRAGEEAALQKIGEAAQQCSRPKPVRKPPKLDLIFGEIEAFPHPSSFVDQPVLPKICGEHETIGREIPFSHLAAVEECLNAVIGPFDLDHSAIGRDAGTPFGVFAAPEHGLLKEAKVGNAIAPRRVMKAVDLWFQFATDLIEQVGDGGVVRRFPRPRQAANPRYLVEICIGWLSSRHRRYARRSDEKVRMAFVPDDCVSYSACGQYSRKTNHVGKAVFCVGNKIGAQSRACRAPYRRSSSLAAVANGRNKIRGLPANGVNPWWR